MDINSVKSLEASPNGSGTHAVTSGYRRNVTTQRIRREQDRSALSEQRESGNGVGEEPGTHEVLLAAGGRDPEREH